MLQILRIPCRPRDAPPGHLPLWCGPSGAAPLVRTEGFEPPRLAPPEPKSGVSANSTTPAEHLESPRSWSRRAPNPIFSLRQPGTRRFSAGVVPRQAPDATLLNIHDMPAPHFVEIVIIQTITDQSRRKINWMAITPRTGRACYSSVSKRHGFPVPGYC